MGWKNEAFIMLGFIVSFLGMFLPHAFPKTEVLVTESWVPFSSEEKEHYKANWTYALVSFLSLPFFYKAWTGIRSMPLWKTSKNTG